MWFCGPDELFFHVSDLDRYPGVDGVDWYAAERLEADSNDQRHLVGGITWSLDWPFARSKKLRMVRTEIIEGHRRFERREVDGAAFHLATC